MSKKRWLGVLVVSCAAFSCSDADDPFGEGEGVGGASAGSPTGGATGGSVTAGTGAGGSAPTGGKSQETGGISAGGTSSGGTATSSGGSSAGGPSASGGGGTPSNAGSGGSTGGRGGRGGGGRSSSGGTASSTGGVVGSSSDDCALLLDGATGDEPDGQIPVCCTPSSAEAEIIQQVFVLLNEHRMSNGESALAYDEDLEATIQGHCMHMSLHDFFEHTAPEKAVSSPWDRAEECGTNANGENIAQGQRSPEDVMEDWIDSPGHNENMLNSRFTRVGIGYFADGRYWGQIFGD